MTMLLNGPWQGVRFIATFIGGMLLSAIAVYAVAPEFPGVAKENHAFENMQLALLLTASMLQLWRAEGLARDAVRERTFAVLLAFLCLACALRELDIDRLGDAQIFEPLEATLRTLTLVALLVYLATHARALLQVLNHRQGLRDPVAWFSFVAVVLYCLSWPLDKKVIPLSIEDSLLLEEWLELWACFFFLAAACVRRNQHLVLVV